MRYEYGTLLLQGESNITFSSPGVGNVSFENTDRDLVECFLEDALNVLGREGWELTTTYPRDSDSRLFFLKRELAEIEQETCMFVIYSANPPQIINVKEGSKQQLEKELLEHQELLYQLDHEAYMENRTQFSPIFYSLDEAIRLVQKLSDGKDPEVRTKMLETLSLILNKK